MTATKNRLRNGIRTAVVASFCLAFSLSSSSANYRLGFQRNSGCSDWSEQTNGGRESAAGSDDAHSRLLLTDRLLNITELLID